MSFITCHLLHRIQSLFYPRRVYKSQHRTQLSLLISNNAILSRLSRIPQPCVRCFVAPDPRASDENPPSRTESVSSAGASGKQHSTCGTREASLFV